MPVTGITVDIEGGDEAIQMLIDINKYLPSIAANKFRKISNNLKSDLQRNMRMAFTAPRGRLEESVKLKHKGFLDYDVMMADYGKYVDTGTQPHDVKRPNLFGRWQRLVRIKSLSSAIHYKGTKPRPFIYQTKQRDLPKRLEQFNNEFLSELKIKMKGGK